MIVDSRFSMLDESHAPAVAQVQAISYAPLSAHFLFFQAINQSGKMNQRLFS